MRLGHTTTMTAAIALGFGFSSIASAQSPDFKIPTNLSYASSKRDTWNTILIVSGAVMVIGLLQDESALTILGGAGVIVSFVQLNQNNYRPNYAFRGLDLVRSGPLSVGFSPFGQLRPAQGFNQVRPSGYITANFKF